MNEVIEDVSKGVISLPHRAASWARGCHMRKVPDAERPSRRRATSRNALESLEHLFFNFFDVGLRQTSHGRDDD
jgi:hypothetical protein